MFSHSPAHCCTLPSDAPRYHLDAIADKLVNQRAKVVEEQAKFEDFKAVLRSRETLRAGYRSVKFYKGYHNCTKKWCYLLERHILRPHKPDYQTFADEMLCEPVTNDDGGLSWVPVHCCYFSQFKKRCLELWQGHLEKVRWPHFKELQEYVLLQSDVCFCTVDSLHKEAMRPLRGDVHSLFVDEASLVPEEAVAVLALFNPTSLVMIGDQEQLRPFSAAATNTNPAKAKRATRSFFERCVDAGVPYTMLKINYRCQPDLVGILNKLTYGGELIAHKQRPETRAPSVHWIDHRHPEKLRVGSETSWCNLGEVEEVRKLYHHLRARGCKNIMVITFYERQRQHLEAKVDLEDRDQIVELADLDQIVTVDSCQGSESRTIIISCVRSNPRGRIGFTEDPNRLNVAISRPKDALYIVGNRDTFGSCTCNGEPQNPGWFNLIAAIDALSADHAAENLSRLSLL